MVIYGDFCCLIGTFISLFLSFQNTFHRFFFGFLIKISDNEDPKLVQYRLPGPFSFRGLYKVMSFF